MDQSLLHIVAAICAAWGVAMLLAPRSLVRLEEALNRDWGQRPVFTLRTGMRGERRVEELLNTRLGTRSVVWDDLLRSNPRATGAGLCCAAALLWLVA